MREAKESKRIVLIHALSASIAPIQAAFAQAWPAAEAVNLMDDSLSVDRARDGCLSAHMTARFKTLTDYAVGNDADAVLFTCSAFHEAIDAARADLSIPVLTPDEAMMERALEIGGRIRMLATFEPTLATATQAMHVIAARAGKAVDVQAVHVVDALAALQAGDSARHERLIVSCAAQQTDCDVILLAQFSMSSAAAAVQAAVACPVLTSPATAVAKLKTLLAQ
jgi:Asp/Glu/hydantoin racemase